MSTRLRNQEVTARPRIIADAGEYTVQWLGKYTGQFCEFSYPNLGAALSVANNVATANRDYSR